MSTGEALLRTIGSIYSVPGNTRAWSDAIGSISELVGARASAYLMVDAADGSVEAAEHSGFPQEVVDAYLALGGAARDVRFKYSDKLVPGKVFRDFEYVPDRAEYDSSEWIQYQLKAIGAYWCMSAKISTHGAWHDYISVNRLKARGPHTDEEKSDLQALLPHLARAAELHRTMTGLESRYGAVLAVLDKLLVGLVIVDSKGRVAVANAAGRRVMEESGALRLKPDGRLHANNPQSDGRLQALIASTSRTAPAEGQSDGGSLVLARRDGRGHLLAEVMPLRDDGFTDSDNLRGAAVFLLDPTSPYVVSIEGLARIFALTPTEQSVAGALINGADPKQIAVDRGRSVETVRCQLKTIFSKTGTNSQLELLRLAVRANPPIAEKGIIAASFVPSGKMG